MQTPSSGPALADASTSPQQTTPMTAALFALAVLFGMNLLNYIDRYVFFSLGEKIQRELHLTDLRFGVLSASFMIVYTIVSPLVGWLGDRYNRRRILAFGVGLWSVATVGTAYSGSFAAMFFWRALLGVGEASYGVIAPAMLSDLFAPRYRGRVIGAYYLALPVGGALGYALGGRIGAFYGWRSAFLVVGLPGLLIALLGLVIRDPGRGASEGRTAADPARNGEASRAEAAPKPRLAGYLQFFGNRSFLYNTAGMAAVTFTTGAYAVWGATFYQRVRGMSLQDAGAYIGGLTALAGLLGILLGSWLADFLLRYTRRAYLLLAFVSVSLAIPFGLAGILDPDWRSSLALLFVAMVLMASVLGPCNTVTANVVPAHRRAAGYALSIFLVHLFGDISSPLLIGWISDFLGRPAVAQSPIGRLFVTLGAVPVASPTGPTNLTVGMLAVIPVMILGSLFFLIGSRHLARDQENALGAGNPAPAAGAFH